MTLRRLSTTYCTSWASRQIGADPTTGEVAPQCDGWRTADGRADRTIASLGEPARRILALDDRLSWRGTDREPQICTDWQVPKSSGAPP